MGSIDRGVVYTHDVGMHQFAGGPNFIKKGLLKKLDYSRFCFLDSDQQKELQKGIKPRKKDLLQRKIADLLLKELPDNEEKAEQVAGNLLDAQNDLEQCRWLAKAGDIYVKSFRAKEALQCYLKVLDDLSNLKGSHVDSLFIETVIKYSRIADFQQLKLRHILPYPESAVEDNASSLHYVRDTESLLTDRRLREYRAASIP